jgi:hypothetical protein
MKNSNRIEIGGQGKTFSKRECSCYHAGGNKYVVQLSVWDHLGRCAVDHYDVRPIPGAQFGRAAFRFVKAVAKAERPTYNVLLDGERSTCDCPHGTYKAHQLGPCRHVLAAEALVKAGKLPTPKAAPRVVHVPARLDGKAVRVPATVDAPAPQPAEDVYCTDDDADGLCWGPDDVVSLAPAAANGGAA